VIRNQTKQKYSREFQKMYISFISTAHFYVRQYYKTLNIDTEYINIILFTKHLQMQLALFLKFTTYQKKKVYNFPQA